MNYYLGIHCGHDATATLINDEGEIIAAVAEERISRVKYHAGFPYLAIDEVLRIGGVQKTDIKFIASSTKRLFFPESDWYNNYLLSADSELKDRYDISNLPKHESALKKISKLVLAKFSSNKTHSKEEIDAFSENLIRKTLLSNGFKDFELMIVDHHHCHAASAYYLSGKQDALIITMDGAGDGKCASASLGKDNKIDLLSSASSNCSPGRLYSEITRFLGFKRNRHEGKITGLAAYGNADKYAKNLRQYMRFDEKTEQFTWNKPVESAFKQKVKTLKRILKNENFGNPHIDYFHEYLTNNFDRKKDAEDLSAAVQLITEEIAVEYVKHFLQKNPSKNILLAGGVFANVKVNQRIGEIDGVDFVYVHQNMGDGGCATGAVYTMWSDKNPEKFPKTPLNVYYGASYTDEKIEKELNRFSEVHYVLTENIETKVAELLHLGKIVGRFYGGMEYGPRSLGNRSILANTTDKSINDWLNKRLNRTEFMPFAPSVLAEESDNLFIGFNNSSTKYASEFMTVTYDVVESWHDKLQAAVHVDGTARPQVVSAENNPEYHKLISEYFKLSGIPGLINTSFNSHEEPIVMTPNDAIRSLIQGTVDILAIGNYLVELKSETK